MSVFQPGEPCLLVDGKGRHYLVKLDPERQFQYHRGVVDHSAIIGRDDGTWVEASSGDRLLALRPRLADYILRMRRGAQVVYPKDIGPILVYADIAPARPSSRRGPLGCAHHGAGAGGGERAVVRQARGHARQGRGTSSGIGRSSQLELRR